MATVDSYTAKDRRIDTALVVGGVATAGVLIWLFGGDKEERDANDFAKMWELINPDALNIAAYGGVVYPYEVEAVADNPARMSQIMTKMQWLADDATGIIDDREDLVVAALMWPTYAETLLFSQLFTIQYGVSPGAFVLTFMSPSSDEGPLSMVVNHIKDLRLRNATTHAGHIIDRP